jgi:hypothetical protein
VCEAEIELLIVSRKPHFMAVVCGSLRSNIHLMVILNSGKANKTVLIKRYSKRPSRARDNSKSQLSFVSVTTTVYYSSARLECEISKTSRRRSRKRRETIEVICFVVDLRHRRETAGFAAAATSCASIALVSLFLSPSPRLNAKMA